eukprot:3934608-Alexandrium_andersonii.AAC.1
MPAKSSRGLQRAPEAHCEAFEDPDQHAAGLGAAQGTGAREEPRRPAHCGVRLEGANHQVGGHCGLRAEPRRVDGHLPRGVLAPSPPLGRRGGRAAGCARCSMRPRPPPSGQRAVPGCLSTATPGSSTPSWAPVFYCAGPA